MKTYQEAKREAQTALKLRDAAERYSTEYAFQHGRYCGLRLAKVLSEADARNLCDLMPADFLPDFLRGMQDTAPYHGVVYANSLKTYPDREV